MLLEVTLNIHIDPERWQFFADLDSEDDVAEDVIEFLKDTIDPAFEGRDQQGVIDVEHRIL